MTGKLIQCAQLENHEQFKGYDKVSQYRGRVLICKQDFESAQYIYKSVEILSSTEVYEHAMIISPD